MRFRFAFLGPVVLVALVALFAVVAGAPAAAAPGGSDPAPATCVKAAPAAASLAPLWLQTVAPAAVTYCYDSKAACDNAQKQASGTKSACYYDKKKGKYCFDLYPPAVADPEPIGP